MKPPRHREQCHYCARAIFPKGSAEVLANQHCQSTRDHTIPHSHTKASGMPAARIVRACWFCNNLKSDAPPEVFAWFMRNCTEKKEREIQIEWKRLRYMLLKAGFRAAEALARAPRRERAVPVSPPRASNGRYTRRDLDRDRRTA